jgi:hypothetical protein
VKYPAEKIASENDYKTGSEIFFEETKQHFTNFNHSSGLFLILKHSTYFKHFRQRNAVKNCC